MRSQPSSAASPGRVAAASCIGTTIEWYDFFIFSTAAALMFNKVFFPEVGSLQGTMLSFATFGVGFVARPLGAIFFGHFGDKRGRRQILMITLLLMGLATFAIGLLPAYATAGVLAPILLVILRIIQGFAVGGEFGGATLMAVEHATPRKKALFGSFVPLGSPIGLLLATTVFLAVQALPSSSLQSFGWRIPFLLSVLLIPVGFVIRVKLTESPEFEAAEVKEALPRVPIAEVGRRHWSKLLIGIGAFTGNFAAYYLLTSFALVYATNTLGMSKSVTLPANIIAAISEGLFILVAALASLRIASRTIAWTTSIGLLVWAFPAYALMRAGEPAALWVSTFVTMIFVGASYGVLPSLVSQLFPTELRYTGISVCYQFAGVIGGGLSPLLATYLLDVGGGSIWPVAGFASAAAVVMTLCCLLLPKSQVPERDRTDEGGPASSGALNPVPRAER
ncbi:MFS transporter [Amycolatopsis nivea]|uniref:MFS transporter n=1 Tax=Amycolatopsis nivea TaxID=1644109 RepID=UPI00106F757E|nr:MFS transporter [Amycolatopsis nivea]